ncbi:hypothetical protein G7046_g7125 [Stylonectria norvegica]|nr:hypothetical protein G7046_g7125 [Stylonectria norvegica]
MVVTPSRRAKRLIRRLSAWQNDDDILTPATTPLIRYNLLHNSRRCVQISVDLGHPSRYMSKCLSFHHLPNFLRSQLEAQKITDDTSLWTQLRPLLYFIHSQLRSSHQPHGFPTLFRWYSEEKHRSFLFFAFIGIKMPSRVYTACDLLAMRHTPLGTRLFERLCEKLKQDADLGDIVRVPLERSLSLITEDKKNLSSDSDDRSISHRASARQLDGTDSEWKYRGRTDSEHTETQPIAAPTGVVAQKDEGFRRFYKAVVSPTHVRVTAGGRIVPNTRGSLSPTSKWTRERVPADGSSNSRPPSSGQPEHVPCPIPQQAPYGGFTPMLPGFAPGMPGMLPGMTPAMAPGGTPFPIMPMPMGFNMAGGFGMPAPTFNHFSAAKTIPNQSNSSSRSDKHSEAGAVDKAQPVRISPPEQFDQSRPFYYNGQWMMPAGNPYYPYGMFPSPGYPAAPLNGAMPSVLGTAVGPTSQQTGHKYSQPTQPSFPPHAPQAASITASRGSTPLANPPMSSIRPSDITKKQIETLRGSLRYLEDQLQYNKHQIDEKAMERQAQLVRQQIQHFERNLETQLAFEQSNYPKGEKQKTEVHSSSSTGGLQSGTPATSEAESDTRPDETARQDGKVQQQIVQSKPGKTKAPGLGPNVVKSGVSFPKAKFAVDIPREDTERLRKASSLPINAALAPPFQPRMDMRAQASTEHLVPKGGSEGKSFFKNAHPAAGFGVTYDMQAGPSSEPSAPYLVGELAPGVRPEVATDTDYVYGRELTEDELRARHMYWGKTPRHLQKGLPKFDGKDFYPPSPDKSRSAAASASSGIPIRLNPTENVHAEYEKRIPMAETDPFQSLDRSGPMVLRAKLGDITQSESLPRQDHSMLDTTTSDIPRPESCATQVGTSYSEFRKAIDKKVDPLSQSSKGRSSSDEGDDDRNLLFRGRRSMDRAGTKTHNDIWQSMLKKGKSSANVVPGKISSTTAQGVLPNYAGHATASLTPAIANTTVTPREAGTKLGEAVDNGLTHGATEKRGENRPPTDIRLDETMRGVGL